MRVGQKLILGFLVVALSVGVVGGVGYYALTITAGKFDAIVDVDAIKIGHLTDAYIIYMKQCKNALEYVTEVEPGEDNKQEFFDEQKEFEKSLNCYLKLCEEHKYKHESALIHKAKSEYDAFIETSKQLFADYESEKDIEGMQPKLKAFDHIGDVFENHLVKLIGLSREDIERSDKEADALRDVSKLVSIMLSTVILLLALIMGYFISRSISNPVTKLREATIEIGKGKLDTKIEIKSKDEIGELSTSFNRMTEELSRFRDELVAARDYADNIIKSMIDTLIVVDPEGRIKTINKATSELLGYEEKELIDKPIGIILEEEVFINAKLKKLIKDSSIRDYEMTYKAKSGEEIPVNFSGSVMRQVSCPFRDKPISDCPEFKKKGMHCEKIIGIVGIAHDMREIKRLMQKEKEVAAATASAEAEKKRTTELEKAYKELEKSQDASLNIMEDLDRKSKELEAAMEELKETQERLIRSEKLATVGRLAGGVAHEINNPLTSILLNIQRMSHMIKEQAANNADSKVYLRSLERAERATNKCKKIVAGLLASSRPPELELAPIDVNAVIEETLESLQDRVEIKNVRVVRHLTANLPRVDADGAQLGQVFSNLIMNACDAMPKGGRLSIITRSQRQEAGAQGDALGEAGETVEIEFSDTGKGISKEDMLRVFDPFFTTKEPGEGVGLGLSISYVIIEKHGGTIEVKSEKGKGTRFIVSLPSRVKK